MGPAPNRTEAGLGCERQGTRGGARDWLVNVWMING